MAKNTKAGKAETNKDADDKDFPGYPHYPANEDIMNSKDAERITVDVENLSRSNLTATAKPDEHAKTSPVIGNKDDDDLRIVPGTEADVTPDDLVLLREKDIDFGRKETLTGDDLDVPGSEEDDANEDIGEEDEENNYYSLGGDAHENLEEDRQ